MSKEEGPSAVAKRINVKFLTNENVKPAEILMRLRTQFDYEAFSRTQVYGWSKFFKGSRTYVANIRILLLLQGKLWPAISEPQGVLFIDFQIEQRNINTAHYLKLLNSGVKLTFRSKRRS
jgi:hypothetical protein